MAASLKSLLGQTPAQFAEMKAATMAQFNQALDNGVSAEIAFNNALAQLTMTLANSDFGGLQESPDVSCQVAVQQRLFKIPDVRRLFFHPGSDSAHLLPPLRLGQDLAS